MSKHIFEDYDIEILPKRRLNQDILENMFSLVRSRCGNNRNPSPKEFNNALKFLMNMKIIVPEIKRKAANCTFDLENSYNNINLICEDIDVAETIVESPNTEESEPYEDNFNISEVQLSAIKVDDEQVNNVVTYFVSYVTNKIIQRNKCDDCCSHLIKERNIIIPREYFCVNKS